MMGKDLFKLALIAGAIAFAILFGMELASSGISNVYGPMDPQNGSTAARTEPSPSPQRQPSPEPEPRPTSVAGRYGNEPDGISLDGTEDPAIPRSDRNPVVDRLAGKTGEALQTVTREGIKFVVDLFG